MASLDGEVLARLGAVNHIRRRSLRSDSLEGFFEARFGAPRRLAAYGSLAPGRAHHDQLAQLEGIWCSGLTVHGDPLPGGWGEAIGHPAIRWRLGGPARSVHLLVSPALPSHWARLDAFEGSDYVRILTPVFDGPRFVTVANLYEGA